MLVHICCSVDSHYFLQNLKKEYPNEDIVGFFYDPNIHPYSEYLLRLEDVKYSCKKLNIRLIEGEYNYLNWLNKTKALSKEPEKGKRCEVCFDIRLEESIKLAKKLNKKAFTTTLLISPKKSQQMLDNIGKILEQKYNVKWLFKDYRKNMHIQSQVVKENNLYRQDYCGCFFALNSQRKEKEQIADELFCDIFNRILPSSIEERLSLFRKRKELDEKNIKYKIIKERFLNYRMLIAKVEIKKEVVNSYFLFYSTLRNSFTKARIEFENNGIFYLNRDEVKILNIKTLNKFLDKNYKNIKELYKEPLSIDEEIFLREKITNTFNLSTIIILDNIIDNRYDITLKSKIYNDTKDILIVN